MATGYFSVPRAGLRDTLRFRWRGEGQVMERDVFGRLVLLGLLRVRPSEVLCLQTHSAERSYDVTWNASQGCRRVVEECERLADVQPLALFEVVRLDRPNFRLVTVHVYNPHVTAQAVAGFLGRYGEVLTATPRRLLDSLGFWTGKRQFQVLLRPDPGGFEGCVHPPALFSIGADRGYCFYSRQPPFCRRCRTAGHAQGACSTCTSCGGPGHSAAECPLLRRGQQQRREPTYAEAARGMGERAEATRPAGPGDLPRAPLENLAPGRAGRDPLRLSLLGLLAKT